MSDERRVETAEERSKRAAVNRLRAAAVIALLFCAPAMEAATASSSREVRTPRVDRLAVENLQRWVNSGHDAWCKDPLEVAAGELRRIAPQFSGDRMELVSEPAVSANRSGTEAHFTWVSTDGSATYRITVRRFAWLKRVAGKVSNEVWIPSRMEVTRTEQGSAPKRSPELPRA
jgi:hypothetical protein